MSDERIGCSWCGLRVAKHILYASPTCTECRDGGRKFRIKAAVERLRRAAGE